jgi:hypothetical protein
VLSPDDRPALADLAPLLHRAGTLEPDGLARLRLIGSSATVLVRLPFAVLVSRTVRAPARAEPLDMTMRGAELIAWLDGPNAPPPANRDAEWRAGLPPPSGWRRLETVPDDIVRGLVRTGAVALQDAAAREGATGAQPRAEVADALLDSIVLTVNDDAGSTDAEVTLRPLSALIRMGFSPRGGHVHIDSVGRWIRVVAEYGTVYLERPGQALLLR